MNPQGNSRKNHPTKNARKPRRKLWGCPQQNSWSHPGRISEWIPWWILGGFLEFFQLSNRSSSIQGSSCIVSGSHPVHMAAYMPVTCRRSSPATVLLFLSFQRSTVGLVDQRYPAWSLNLPIQSSSAGYQVLPSRSSTNFAAPSSLRSCLSGVRWVCQPSSCRIMKDHLLWWLCGGLNAFDLISWDLTVSREFKKNRLRYLREVFEGYQCISEEFRRF